MIYCVPWRATLNFQLSVTYLLISCFSVYNKARNKYVLTGKVKGLGQGLMKLWLA